MNKKFDSTSSSTLVALSELLHSSALTDIWTDPEEWIVELEILQIRLAALNYVVTDQQLIIHVLHHLPNEYENLVDDLERALNDQVNPLNVEI